MTTLDTRPGFAAHPAATRPNATRLKPSPIADIATLSLERIGGLPAEILDIVSDQTGPALDRYTAAHAMATRIAEELSDQLYTVVPSLPKKARRQVINNRRAIHQLTAVSWSDATIEALQPLLSEDDWQRLSGWNTLLDELAQAHADVAAAAAASEMLLNDQLSTAFSDSAYTAALAVAAPDWMSALLAHGRPDTDRQLRTELQYAMRAAVKTSPLAGLTTVRITGRTGRGRATSRLAAYEAVAIHDEFATRPDIAPAIR